MKRYTEFSGLQAEQCHKPVGANKSKRQSCVYPQQSLEGLTTNQIKGRRHGALKSKDSLNSRTELKRGSDSLRSCFFGTPRLKSAPD